MGRYEVEITGWRPTSTSQLLAVHWSQRRKLKASDAARVALHLEQAGIPRIAVPRAFIRSAIKKQVAANATEARCLWREPLDPACKRLVLLTVHLGRDANGRLNWLGKKPDRDNLHKSLLDSLTEGGWLVDDRDEWCETDLPEFVPDDGTPARTHIVLEDLP